MVKTALQPGKDTFVRWSAAQQGFDLVIRPTGPGAITVDYAAIVEQWPAGAKPLPPRRANVMPFDTSDSTTLEGTRRFSW